MYKHILISFFIFITFHPLHAQTDVDALRYATPNVQGTARNMALGNTMGTIGSDISSVSTNPAGIAKYSSTEIVLTPAISISNSSSSFINNTTKDSKLKFQLANIGVVVSRTNSDKGDWNGLKFGFAVNRLANYNSKYFFSGYNDKNSLLNSYYEKLNDRSYITDSADAADNYPFDASIAYQLGLITIDSTGRTYTATNNGNMQQEFQIQKSGGINEVALGFGSMYKDKLMIGASIGLPIINYTERIHLEEKDVRDSAYDLISFVNENYLRSRGFGFNLKVGIIATPINGLRLSFAIQTPSLIFMRESYSTHMEVDYASASVIYTGDSPDGSSKYNYRQPWKVTLGTGYIHKYGLISFEYDVSDAGSSKINFGSMDINSKPYENYLNNLIRQKYGVFHTIKVGVEFKYDPIRIRGGIQYRTSPFKKEFAPDGVNAATLIYSAGFGYRGKHFFADIAYVQTNSKELFVPYQLSTASWNPVPAATLSTKNPLIVLSLGYKL